MCRNTGTHRSGPQHSNLSDEERSICSLLMHCTFVSLLDAFSDHAYFPGLIKCAQERLFNAFIPYA
jgi:hypothetical protein